MDRVFHPVQGLDKYIQKHILQSKTSFCKPFWNLPQFSERNLVPSLPEEPNIFSVKLAIWRFKKRRGHLYISLIIKITTCQIWPRCGEEKKKKKKKKNQIRHTKLESKIKRISQLHLWPPFWKGPCFNQLECCMTLYSTLTFMITLLAIFWLYIYIYVNEKAVFKVGAMFVHSWLKTTCWWFRALFVTVSKQQKGVFA